MKPIKEYILEPIKLDFGILEPIIFEFWNLLDGKQVKSKSSLFKNT